MAERLVVWLYGTPVCVLERSADYRFSITWLSDAVTRWGAGSRILSVSLPFGSRISPSGLSTEASRWTRTRWLLGATGGRLTVDLDPQTRWRHGNGLQRIACLRLARSVGLEVPEAELITIDTVRDSSGIELAPVYDVVATVALQPVDERGRRIEPDRRMGDRVGEASLVDDVTRAPLVIEGASWGLPTQRAADVVGDMLARIAAIQIDDARLAELVSSNLKRMR